MGEMLEEMMTMLTSEETSLPELVRLVVVLLSLLLLLLSLLLNAYVMVNIFYKGRIKVNGRLGL